MKTHSRRNAFTLIELMVVVGLIALVLAGMGTLLSNKGGSAHALGSASAGLSSLVSAARARAALTGNVTAVFVNNDPSNNATKTGYLQQCFIAEKNTSGAWTRTDTVFNMPQGIYVVPQTAPSPLTRGSSALKAMSATFNNISTWMGVEFDACGKPLDGTGGDILV